MNDLPNIPVEMTDDLAWELILGREGMIRKHVFRRCKVVPDSAEYEDVISAARIRMHSMLLTWDPSRTRNGDIKLFANQCVGWSVGIAITQMLPSNEGRYGILDVVCLRAWKDFADRHGRSPSDEELIKEIGDTPSMGRFTKKGELSLMTIRRWKTTGGPGRKVDIDAPMYDTGTRTYGDVIPSGGRPVDEAADLNMKAIALESEIDELDERSQGIVRGLGEGMSLSELAGPLGLSRERVRQIYVAAVKKIRAGMGVSVPGPIRTPGPMRLSKQEQKANAIKRGLIVPRESEMNEYPKCSWSGCDKQTKSRRHAFCQRDSSRIARLKIITGDDRWSMLTAKDVKVVAAEIEAYKLAWEAYDSLRPKGRAAEDSHGESIVLPSRILAQVNAAFGARERGEAYKGPGAAKASPSLDEDHKPDSGAARGPDGAADAGTSPRADILVSEVEGFAQLAGNAPLARLLKAFGIKVKPDSKISIDDASARIEEYNAAVSASHGIGPSSRSLVRLVGILSKKNWELMSMADAAERVGTENLIHLRSAQGMLKALSESVVLVRDVDEGSGDQLSDASVSTEQYVFANVIRQIEIISEELGLISPTDVAPPEAAPSGCCPAAEGAVDGETPGSALAGGHHG